MTFKIFNTSHFNLLKRASDVYEKQHKVIADNIAHATDENYQRITTDFTKELKSAVETSGMQTKNSKHIQSSQWSGTSTTESTSAGKVDLTQEMNNLAVNQIRHELVTRSLQKHFSGLRAAILGRTR